MERRLSAIVCADVAGYSRMMGADEAGTHAAFKAHRSAVYPVILNHGGRLVKWALVRPVEGVAGEASAAP